MAAAALGLGALAGSLDRLVTHLEGISLLMSDLVGRLGAPGAAPQAAEATDTGEPPFRPGGEGISLGIGDVPGFQVLMDIQKALIAMDAIAGASVERFQEGESRILLQLRQPVTASALAAALHRSTGHATVVEEAQPEALRLRLKVLPAG